MAAVVSSPPSNDDNSSSSSSPSSSIQPNNNKSPSSSSSSYHEKNNIDTIPKTATIPEKFIEWMTYHCSSNHELAVLSNICRNWRRVVVDTIIKSSLTTMTTTTMTTMTTTTVAAAGETSLSSSLSHHFDSSSSSSVGQSSSSLHHLLLPAMGREIIRRRRRRRRRQQQSAASPTTTTATAIRRSLVVGPSQGKESYCLAWFPPRGIRMTTVVVGGDGESSNDDDDDDDSGGEESDEVSSHSSSSSSSSSMENSFTTPQRRKKSDRKKKKSINALSASSLSPGRKSEVDAGGGGGGSGGEKRKQTCGKEWRGYKDAMDVLIPFGYKNAFVHSILNAAITLPLPTTQIEQDTSSSTTANNKTLDKKDNSSSDNNPLGFIFKPNSSLPKTITPPPLPNHHPTPHSTFAVRGTLSALPEGLYQTPPNNKNKNNTNTKINQRRQRKQQRHIQKKNAQLYPRVILTNPTPPSPTTTTTRRRQRALQFLNADSTRAVRLRTRPFDDGRLLASQPITIFCIAIATEDGCFLSGLKRRFEVGHLYPRTERERMMDMSNVGISTGVRERVVGGVVVASGGGGGGGEGDEEEEEEKETEEELQQQVHDSSDDDDSSESTANCSSREDSREGFPPEDVICRGRTGPGLWHCYTIIFDGDKSVIRVDSYEEQSSGHCGWGVLDGLTIGSDHRFDMSLCFGGGDAGEGEGSVSELVVFKGRLPSEDVRVMEDYLMRKHGLMRRGEQDGREDRWRRQAHALLVQPAPYAIVEREGVPLWAAARHRLVAWERVNDVTGQVMRVPRIGCRFGNGSSDW